MANTNSSKMVSLVKVIVRPIGGGVVECFDVVDTEDKSEAMNHIVNSFIRAGDNAVVVGTNAFFPGTIAQVNSEYIAAIDLGHPNNGGWKKLYEATTTLDIKPR